MRCGKCKQSPTTLQHVRQCYGLLQADNTHPVGSPPQAKGGPTIGVVPTQVTTGQTTLDVPQGRYGLLEPVTKHVAVPDRWRFYQVDRPTGRWAGYTFVSALASDDKHPIRDRARRQAILERIAENPAKAARDYGQQTGRCGVCNRLLTDPESISRGMGSICAARF